MADSCAYKGNPTTVGTDNTRLEAENYDTCANAYKDTTDGNSGGALRHDDVDISASNDDSNGFAITDTQTGEYLEYSVDVARSGLYTATYHAQAPSGDAASFTLLSDGKAIDNSQVSFTGSDKMAAVISPKFYLTDGRQTLRVKITANGGTLDAIDFHYSEPVTLPARTTVEHMGIGINMGNTLDAPTEGAWAPKAQKYYFTDYRKAGFKHVRIPDTWKNHIDQAAPYTINKKWLDRTEQVVDWALAQNLVVILNAHHDDWIKSHYTDDNKARFDALWTQISERFKHKSARLVFEMLNEPHPMSLADINDLNKRVLGIIRNTNPNRLVLFSGNKYASVNELVKADIPDPNDKHLVGYFHSYDPYFFAQKCTQDWGSQADKDALASIYQKAKDWSEKHNIPVVVDEFGAAHYDYKVPSNKCDQQERLDYLREHVKLATQNGMAATVWDDGGSFDVYKRGERTFKPAKDILVAPNSP